MRYNPTQNIRDITFQLDRLLNEGLELQDNFRGGLFEVTLNAGENTLQHNLGFIPMGYIVLYKSLTGDIFGARVEQWTKTELFLESSVSNQRVRLFVV